jgi:hypothetical protein
MSACRSAPWLTSYVAKIVLLAGRLQLSTLASMGQ